MDEHGVPGVSIALVKEDKIIWTAAFGYLNVKTKTPLTPDTYCSTLSTFKSVTATALMQLVEQGKIDLDEPVNTYLGDTKIRDCIQSDKPVTLRHILSHRSGLNAEAIREHQVAIWGRGRQKLPTLEEMPSGLQSVRAPEEEYEYNNLAFSLIGLLIEKISKINYEEYIVKNVLNPLGITTSNPVFPTPEMVEMMVFPYIIGQNNQLRPGEQIQFSLYPAGDTYLTAKEMACFLGAHLNGGVFNGKRILSTESIKKMHIPQYNGDYALGFHVYEDEQGHTILYHTGKGYGLSSIMIGDVDARVGIYYFSNCNYRFLNVLKALKLMRGDYVPLDEDVLQRYAGKYKAGASYIIDITKEDNNLFIKLPGQYKTELFAESKTKFFLETPSLEITFIVKDNGKAEQMILDSKSQGQKYTFTKMK